MPKTKRIIVTKTTLTDLASGFTWSLLHAPRPTNATRKKPEREDSKAWRKVEEAIERHLIKTCREPNGTFIITEERLVETYRWISKTLVPVGGVDWSVQNMRYRDVISMPTKDDDGQDPEKRIHKGLEKLMLSMEGTDLSEEAAAA